MADAKRLTLGAPTVLGQGGAWSFSNFVINSAGASVDRVAWVVQIPNADTITHLGFRYGARTGTPVQHKIGLQGVGTTGLPDGTFKGGGSPNTGLFTPPADATWDGTWQWVALDNSYASAVGDFVAVVIEPVGTPTGVNNSSFTQGIQLTAIGRGGHPYNLTQTDGAAFSKVAARTCVYGLKSAGAVYGFPLQGLYSTSIGTNGNRQAVKFTLNSAFSDTFKLRGLRVMAQTPATGNNFKWGLWNAAGTEQEGISIDSDWTASVNTGYTTYETYFDDTPVVLTCGTAYYLGLERVDAVCNLFGLQLASANDLPAHAGGSDWFLSTWNGSAWADDTTVRPLVELILDEIAEPTAGGQIQSRVFTGM